jgi:PAS domain S-box-containing protein
LIQDAIIVRDPHDRVVYWNRAAQSLYGWSRREALGVVVHDLLRTRFPGDRAEVMAALRRAGAWDGLLRHQTRDRGEIVTWSRWSVVHDRHGKIASVVETNRDVTDQQDDVEALRSRVVQLQAAVERHELEQSVLRDDVTRWRAIVDAALDAIVSVDDDDRISALNPAATSLLRIAEHDAVGQPIQRFLAASGPRASSPDESDTSEETDHAPTEATACRGDNTEVRLHLVTVRVLVAGRQQTTHIFRAVD